ncbi:hypothetical protein DPMN_075338 [Dreissena polymorpha]|uniref:Uncharacterized protein n=1 Tax=Dreissena polymorpha TaxID=45954 RepID=A0A9D3YGZ9_DREPO|nr:hypothetical protein DPMN_075338 [Dreissena polymorpha]
MNVGSPEDECATPVVSTEIAPVIHSVTSNECEAPKPCPSDDRGVLTFTHGQLNSKALKWQTCRLKIRISKIYRMMRDGTRAPVDEMVSLSPKTRHYWMIWDPLVLVDYVLYRKFQRLNKTHDCLQLVFS